MTTATVTSSIPKDTYYPGCIVNMELRFDEGAIGLSPGPVTSDQAATTPQANTGSTQSATPALARKASDNLTHVLGITPKDCNVEMNGFIHAGTFDFTFAYRDFPIDPRVLRACAVSIHFDTVSESNFAKGMTQSLDRTKPNNRLASILVPTPANLVLYGIVDLHGTDFEDNGAIVHMHGRDLRGLLIDAKMGPADLTALKLDQPLDVVVDHIVNTLFVQGGGIPVIFDSDTWNAAGGIPVPGDIEQLPRHQLDAAGAKARNTVPGYVTKVSYWDLITLICNGVGAIATFVGQELRVVPATSIYTTRAADQAFTLDGTKTPFLDGVSRGVRAPLVTKPETFRYRRLVFGRDINRLSFERKLGGVKVPAVKVHTINTALKGKSMLMTAISPQQVSSNSAANATDVSPGGEIQQTDVIPIKIIGVGNISQSKLQSLADSIREIIGRQEIGGNCVTKNLASFGGGNFDPDMLRLRPGDPVEFRVDASNLTSIPPVSHELNSQASRSEAAQIEAVKARIGKDNDALARILVRTQNGSIPNLNRTFRTANVKLGWSENGVQIDFDFQNYIEARFQLDSSGNMRAAS